MYPIIFQNNSITTVIDNVPYTVDKSSSNYNILIDAYRMGDWEKFANSITPTKVIDVWAGDDLTIKNGEVFFHGTKVGNSIANRIQALISENIPVTVYTAFLENLYDNPSYRAVTEFYEFMENNDLPMTSDGHFLAYRKVRDDYFDCHSKTVPNMLADMLEDLYELPYQTGRDEVEVDIYEDGLTTISMPRNKVNDDSNIHCSNGLHFCGKDYLNQFSGDRIMIMKINPRDVVSFPTDDTSKGRCCRYQLVGEITADQVSTSFDKSVVDLPTPPEKASSPVVSDFARYGTSAFYDGYSAGYSEVVVGKYTDRYVSKQYDEGYQKGWKDGFDDVPMQYVKCPVTDDVKFGDSDFYKGYDAGYRNTMNNYYYVDDVDLMVHSQAYQEGYLKGSDAALDEFPMKYMLTQ